MIGTEFQDCLGRMAISQAAFARLLGRDPVTINRYCHGRLAIPREVALVVMLLELFAPKRRAELIKRFAP